MPLLPTPQHCIEPLLYRQWWAISQSGVFGFCKYTISITTLLLLYLSPPFFSVKSVFPIQGLTQLELFTWTIDHKTFGKTRNLLQNFKQSQTIWSYNYCKTLVMSATKQSQRTQLDRFCSLLLYRVNSPSHHPQPSTLCSLSVLLLISRCPYVAMRGSSVGGPR